VILRCILDGLILHASIDPVTGEVQAFDGTEPFTLEAVEAVYYQLTSATEPERLALQRRYRLLRLADDFETSRDR
jgi:hypothetical protein